MSVFHKTSDFVARPEPYVEQASGSQRARAHEPGIYVDLVSGEALFASSDMYGLGTRWLNFSKPIDPAKIREVQSSSHGRTRTEVRSARGNNHLGHLFPDGLLERGGLRYCIHPALVRFVPRKQMAAEGYGAYLDYLECV
jgi:peptide-methionine (R)-S-oxide reductase